MIKNGNAQVSFDDLLQFPFISREEGSGTRNLIEKRFSEYKQLDQKLEMNDNDSIISTVSDSNYLSIMSEIVIDKAESAGFIKTLIINDYPLIAKRSLFFVRLKDKDLSNLKEKFWDEIKVNV